MKRETIQLFHTKQCELHVKVDYLSWLKLNIFYMTEQWYWCYVFQSAAILSHASLICGRDESKSEGHNLYLLLPIWNLLIIYLQSSIIKNPHFSSKYIYDIYDFLIWQSVYLFFFLFSTMDFCYNQKYLCHFGSHLTPLLV